ncbi:MAG: 4Fe-4S binding protein [Dehalococcoidia bacterium]|nr:4Fe-4S binding protein [Dehalococcoidia bacterium]
MAYKIIETCIGCTACVKKCPTDAISGVRNELHIINPVLCIDCGACGAVCPPESILDDIGDVCRTFPRRELPLAKIIEVNCIGSGCELCIAVCPFDALSLQDAPNSHDFFGISVVDPKRCTGCRLCEQSCGWSAIYIDPPREMLKKRVYPEEILTPKKGRGVTAARERQAETAAT